MSDYKNIKFDIKLDYNQIVESALNTYISPIELYYKELELSRTEAIDKFIYEGVQKVGINVDKERLMQALVSDRKRYEEGYIAGYEKGVNDAKLQLIESLEETLHVLRKDEQEI